MSEWGDHMRMREAAAAKPSPALDRALWLLMQFDITRYLMANTSGRLSGGEKAEKHLSLCETYCKVKLASRRMSIHDSFRDRSLLMFIHDWSQSLTSYLDSAIGFPVDDPHPDYDKLSPKFFDKFIALCDEAWVAAQDQEGDDDFDGKYSHIKYLNSQGR